MQSPSEILEICPSERALPGAHRTLRSVVWSNMVHRPLHHIIAPSTSLKNVRGCLYVRVYQTSLIIVSDYDLARSGCSATACSGLLQVVANMRTLLNVLGGGILTSNVGKSLACTFRKFSIPKPIFRMDSRFHICTFARFNVASMGLSSIP
eukprot:1194444-Prorocentrum_minimum.AAC.3